MKNLGGWLFLLGLGSFALNYFNFEFKALRWIDYWGYAPGIAIRIGLIAVGGVLWLLGRRPEPER